MPRRNRNAGTPRLDVDQLAADLCPDLLTGHGKSTMVFRYLARTITPSSLLVVTGGKQPIPQLTAESG